MLPSEVAERMVVVSAVSPFSHNLCKYQHLCMGNEKVFFSSIGFRVPMSELLEVRDGGHSTYSSNQYTQIYSYIFNNALAPTGGGPRILSRSGPEWRISYLVCSGWQSCL